MTPGEALERALNQLYEHQMRRGITIGQAVEYLGSNSAVAQMMAGTSDKKSREYKAALRTVQRYLKGERGESGQTRGTKRPHVHTTRRVARAVVHERLREDSVIVSDLGGEINVSGEEGRTRSIPFEERIPNDIMASALDLYDAGDREAAADLLIGSYLDAYGLPEDRRVEAVTSLVLGFDH